MRINIASVLYDIDGSIDIDTVLDANEGDTVRRVNRVATIDGGVAVSDNGFAEGDRTLNFTWPTVSKAHNDSVDGLVKAYSELNITTPSAVYLAAPFSFTPGREESSITLLVKSKLSG